MKALPIILLALPLAAWATVPSGTSVGRSERLSAADWTPPPFERYQPILDSKPFGSSPPPPAAAAAQAAPATPPPPPFVSKLVFCAINRTPAGPVVIGFVDGSQNPPKSYYLGKGESADGFTVLEADFATETAVLEKDGVRIELRMGKGPEVASAAPAATAPPAPMPIAYALTPPPVETPSPPAPQPSGIVTRSSDAGRGSTGNLALSVAKINKRRDEIAKIRESGGDVRSYLLQLREREAKQKEATAAAEQAAREQLQALAAKMTAEQLAQREHEINYRLLEQGAQPVSNINLSPEEEKALMEKGVLPAPR